MVHSPRFTVHYHATNKMIWRQDDRKNENTPYCFSPLEVGEIERGDLSACQLFNLSTKRKGGKRTVDRG